MQKLIKLLIWLKSNVDNIRATEKWLGHTADFLDEIILQKTRSLMFSLRPSGLLKISILIIYEMIL